MRQDEEGQVALLVLVAATFAVALALAMVQGGRIGLLDADADSSADAAALAALDALRDELEGPEGYHFLEFGVLSSAVRSRVTSAAAAYADANDARLDDVQFVYAEDRREIVVRVATSTREELGEPALTEEQRRFVGRSIAAASTEIEFDDPTSRGCLTTGQVADLQADLGLPPAPSGLVACGGADVRNLQRSIQEAVVRIEAQMGARVVFASAFRSMEEQLALWNELNPIGAAVAPPGRSYHNYGLAFDAVNWSAIESAIAALPPEQRTLCNEVPDDAVHFSPVEHHECGGPLGLPPFPGVIVTTEPVLVDPAVRP